MFCIFQVEKAVALFRAHQAIAKGEKEVKEQTKEPEEEKWKMSWMQSWTKNNILY